MNMCLHYAKKLAKDSQSLQEFGREKSLEKSLIFARLSNFTSIKQRRVLMKSFIDSQFGYSPLIWMFHGRGVNSKINHLHGRGVNSKINHLHGSSLYKDNNSSFKDLLKKNNTLLFIIQLFSHL